MEVNMKKTTWLALIFGFIGLLIFVLPVQADGIIIPDNPPGPCPQGSPDCRPTLPCIDQNVNCPPCAQGAVCAPCVPPIPCPPPVNPFIQLGIKYHHVTVTI